MVLRRKAQIRRVTRRRVGTAIPLVTTAVDQGKVDAERVGERRRTLSTTRIWRHNNSIAPVFHLVSDPASDAGLARQVVHRNVEEALDLTGVQVHGNHMLSASDSDHVRDHLGRDGDTAFVLLRLT